LAGHQRRCGGSQKKGDTESDPQYYLTNSSHLDISFLSTQYGVFEFLNRWTIERPGDQANVHSTGESPPP
jgi:hypothetical protein